MQKLSMLAVLGVAVPLTLLACGDDEDDDAPPPSAGGSGGAGSGSGGKSSGSGATGSGSGATGSGGTSSGGTDPVGGQGGEGGDDTVPGGCDLSGVGLERENLPVEIDEDLTLTNDRVWVIRDYVKVMDGATLTIPACTRLEGTQSPVGVLAITRGGRINAVGTPDEPILFTSREVPGNRSSGQWGGVVLLGKAPITLAGGTTEKIFEGLTDPDMTYGGNDATDNSGTMQYVRIEFGGYQILPDKEINGLSFGGVGSGTTIDHVMVNQNSDDCFEWWGGTVTADYLVCNNSGDDMFDTDEGFVGGGSHWFGRRTSIDVISSDDAVGFEWDSINSGETPRTAVTATKVTLCGTGADVGAVKPNPEFGMVLRELITGEITDLSLLGFQYAIDTRNAFVAGDVTVDNSAFWSIANAIGAVDSSDNDDGFDDATVFSGGTNNSEPDPVPFTLEDCQAAGGPPAAVRDSDMGAFAGDADWLDGAWVDWSEN